MKKLPLFWIIVLTLFVAGCGTTTRVTNQWKAPNETPKAYSKIMVVGLIHEADRNIREQMENHLVGDLQSMGYKAESAYATYGPKMFEGLSEEEVNKSLVSKGVDAVLTIVLLDKEKERYYVPGQVVYSPYGTYYNHFWGYYTTLYSRIYSPGYYTESTRFFWESNLYDLATNKLIYSVQTQSFDPSSAEDMGHEYGKKILESLVRNNVLTNVKPVPTKAF